MVERLNLDWSALHSTEVSIGESIEIPIYIYSGVAQAHFVLSNMATVPAEVTRKGAVLFGKNLGLLVISHHIFDSINH